MAADDGVVLMHCTRLVPALMFALAGAHAFAAPPPGYQLAWQDDFSGTELDLSKWKPATNRRDSAQLTPDAARVSEGRLRISTYTRDGTHYTAFLTTSGHYQATYGYFESRIRFHDAPGEHCAFWLQSPTLGRPLGDPSLAGTEIDIMEHRVVDAAGRPIGNVASFNLHWDGYGADHKHVGSIWKAPASLDGGWHTYGLLWTPDAYVFYVDDTERWRSSDAVSHAPEEVRLTCEVKENGWAGRIPDSGYGSADSSPYGMEVNWVRVWQLP